MWNDNRMNERLTLAFVTGFGLIVGIPFAVIALLAVIVFITTHPYVTLYFVVCFIAGLLIVFGKDIFRKVKSYAR